MADSLLIELRALPHDTTRLKLLEKLVLTEQNSPHYIEYAEEMFNEAQRQKNPKYICSSTYFKILYYYNKNEVDSVSKLVNYVKPIAKRMEFSGCTSMHKNCLFILIHIRRNMNMPSMNH